MTWLDEIRKRLEAATPQTKCTVAERIYHGDGTINYEVNDEHHLVAFSEYNHEQIIRAKFNAELYANARTDVARLLRAVDILRDALGWIASGVSEHDAWDAAQHALAAVAQMGEKGESE